MFETHRALLCQLTSLVLLVFAQILWRLTISTGISPPSFTSAEGKSDFDSDFLPLNSGSDCLSKLHRRGFEFYTNLACIGLKKQVAFSYHSSQEFTDNANRVFAIRSLYSETARHIYRVCYDDMCF